MRLSVNTNFKKQSIKYKFMQWVAFCISNYACPLGQSWFSSAIRERLVPSASLPSAGVCSKPHLEGRSAEQDIRAVTLQPGSAPNIPQEPLMASLRPSSWLAGNNCPQKSSRPRPPLPSSGFQPLEQFSGPCADFKQLAARCGVSIARLPRHPFRQTSGNSLPCAKIQAKGLSWKEEKENLKIQIFSYYFSAKTILEKSIFALQCLIKLHMKISSKHLVRKN